MYNCAMNYSRNMLLSLRKCWKFGNQVNGVRHASLPLSKYVWNELMSLNILASTRGKRGGRHILLNVANMIPVLHSSISRALPKRVNSARFAVRENLLNIQVKTCTYDNRAKTRDEFVPSLLSNVMSLAPKID